MEMISIGCYHERMTNRTLYSALALVAIAVVGVLLGQTDSEPASPSPPPLGADEWQMISQMVSGSLVQGSAGPAGSADPAYGDMFLFNRRTGKVYRFFDTCGAGYENGCLVPVPIIDEGAYQTVVPRPQAGNGGRSQFER